jgi:hypothetical protein
MDINRFTEKMQEALRSASQAAYGKWGDSIAPLSLLCLAIASWAFRPASRTLGALFSAEGQKRNRLSAAATI